MALWWQFLLASLTWSVREMIPSGVGFQLVVLISVTFWPASLSASAVLEALLDPMTRKPPGGGCPMSSLLIPLEKFHLGSRESPSFVFSSFIIEPTRISSVFSLKAATESGMGMR